MEEPLCELEACSCSHRSISPSSPLDTHTCIRPPGGPPHTPCPQDRGSSHTRCSGRDSCHLRFKQTTLRPAPSEEGVRARGGGGGSTFTLACGGPRVAWGHEAEAGRAVGGHGAFVQRDRLVAETQRAVQTCAELLDHPDDPDPRHLFDHPGGRVQLTEDNLRVSRRGG